jgi:hypothetical protein
MYRLTCLTLVMLLTAVSTFGQQVFKGTDKVWKTDLFDALDDAVDRTEGDILILFYHPNDDQSDRIARHLYENELMGQFIEDNFATVAIEIGSPQWKRLQNKYRRESPADWPHIVVDVRKFLASAEFHGWENNQNADSHLEYLQLMKQQGAVQGDVRKWTPSGQPGL